MLSSVLRLQTLSRSVRMFATAAAGATTKSAAAAGSQAVWKKHPAKDTMLMERTLPEMLHNLQMLVKGSAASGQNPPRPEALHRIFNRVASAEDLEIALKGYRVARGANIRFTDQTTTLLSKACFRVGRANDLVALLDDPEHSRLFATRSTLQALTKLAITEKNAKYLTDVVRIMSKNKMSTDADTAGLFVLAYLANGKVKEALTTYKKLRAAVAPKTVAEVNAQPIINLVTAFAGEGDHATALPFGDSELMRIVKDELLVDAEASKRVTSQKAALLATLKAKVAEGASAPAPAPAAAAESSSAAPAS